MKWYIYAILILFISDFIYRSFFKKKINKNINQYYNIGKSALNKNGTMEEVNKYNKNIFNSEIINFYDNEKQRKIDSEINEEENDEFAGMIPKLKKRINITIVYDESQYEELYKELTSQLDGNFTLLSFYKISNGITPYQKFIKIILYISLVISIIFLLLIDVILKKCCFCLNEIIVKLIINLKFVFCGISFIIHRQLIKKYSSSNYFEVYINNKLRYSTITQLNPPTYNILSNIIKNIKKNN